MDFSNIFSVQQGDPAGPYASPEAAQTAGAVTMNGGLFINTVISFLLVAFAVFLLVKWINRLKREAEEEVVEKPASLKLTADQKLLTEICDLLKEGAR